MSSSYSEEIVYKCGTDCRMEGCPSHKLKIHYHHTSDTVTVLLDGQHYVTFDDVMWSKLRLLDDARHNPDARAHLDVISLTKTIREVRDEMLSDGYHRPNEMLLKMDAALGEDV